MICWETYWCMLDSKSRWMSEVEQGEVSSAMLPENTYHIKILHEQGKCLTLDRSIILAVLSILSASSTVATMGRISPQQPMDPDGIYGLTMLTFRATTWIGWFDLGPWLILRVIVPRQCGSLQT